MKLVVSAILATVLLHIAARQPVLAAGEEWTGSVSVATASVYGAPGGTLVDSLNSGTIVAVVKWVYGPALTADNYTWADLGSGRFVHSSTLRHSPLPSTPLGTPLATPQIISTAHWADADLTQQILTLYDGDRPVHLALMNSGRPGVQTETHLGVWPIQRRVADETMRGDGYDISGVLFTQYFTDDAEAIHLNYWLDDNERGIPRSHGCIGLAYADAALAWRFLDIGSVVYVHD